DDQIPLRDSARTTRPKESFRVLWGHGKKVLRQASFQSIPRAEVQWGTPPAAAGAPRDQSAPPRGSSVLTPRAGRALQQFAIPAPVTLLRRTCRSFSFGQAVTSASIASSRLLSGSDSDSSDGIRAIALHQSPFSRLVPGRPSRFSGRPASAVIPVAVTLGAP